MTLRSLPNVVACADLQQAHFDVRRDAVENWDSAIRNATTDDANTISILDVIGENWDGDGVTSKRIGAALRSIGANPVVVNINSPGGDFFEGVAIYNQLRSHPYKVTVNVLGLAASAASLIAMAGDEVNMADASFLMIHNAWCVAMGNRHDLVAASARLEPFDDAIAGVYAARAGKDKSVFAKLMDEETWLSTADAVANGLADKVQQVPLKKVAAAAGKQTFAMLESSLRQSGYSRGQCRAMIKDLVTGKPSAVSVDGVMPGADYTTGVAASLRDTILQLTRKES